LQRARHGWGGRLKHLEEDGGAVKVTLVGGAEHRGEDLLGGGAAQLAGNHDRAERLLGPPVGRVDRRVEEAAKDRGELGGEVRGEALDGGRPAGLFEEGPQPTDDTPARDGQPVGAQRALVRAVGRAP